MDVFSGHSGSAVPLAFVALQLWRASRCAYLNGRCRTRSEIFDSLTARQSGHFSLICVHRFWHGLRFRPLGRGNGHSHQLLPDDQEDTPYRVRPRRQQTPSGYQSFAIKPYSVGSH